MEKAKKTAIVSVRIAPDVKEKATEIYKTQYGLTLTDAVNIFFYQTIAAGGIPFEMKNKEPNAQARSNN